MDNCPPPAKVALNALIVEDNLLIALDLESVLKDAHCSTVNTAADELTAITQVLTEQVDVVFVEPALASGYCHALIDKLRERGTPFALCTACPHDLVGPGFDGVQFIGKPCSDRAIKSFVQRCVDQIRAEILSAENAL